MRTTRFPWLLDDVNPFGITELSPMDNITGTEADDVLGDTSGNDVVWGLGGNDTLLSTQGYDVLLGGSGDDEYMTTTASSVLIHDESGDDLAGLALANSDTGYTRLVVRDGAGDQIADLTWQSDRATIEAADAAGARFEFIRWTSGAWTIQHAVEGVEHFQVTGSDTNDLLLARGSKGGAFDGRGGFDTFWADWSSSSSDISWVNTPSLTQTVNGIQIAGVERLILRTGGGHDTIDNRGNGSSTDDLVTGAGNDWVALDQGTVDTGSGDDTITQAWGSVDGGTDSDTLHMGGVYNSDTGYTRLVALDAGGNVAGDLVYSSSRADIENALSSATQFDFVSWWSSTWRTQLHTAHIEHWNVQGSNTADLIVARGNGDTYAGHGGFDGFYADWSAATGDIAWTNTPASTQSVNGLSVSGFERLILRTGGGHDTIDNRGNGSSTDDLVTGAGNDWVALDQGTVDTGSGDDTITMAWGSVDGGADSDMLHMGGVYNSDTGYTRLVALDAGGNVAGDLVYSSSRADIENALSSATQFDFVSWWSSTWRTQLHTANIEHWNITGSATADLIIARGEGSEYHGGGGFDTFYADWSAATGDIAWANTPASTQTVNSLSVSGFERLILRTGGGHDTIDNRGNGSSTDDLVTGAGNDWVALDQGTVDSGSGDDTITQAWGSVDGGTDSDMLHMGGVYNSDTGYTRLVALDAGGNVTGDLSYSSSRTDIETALSSATQFDFVSWWSSTWRTQLHTANIEHWNITGSATADLIIARGEGSEYHGGGGFDTIYADWSAATGDIAWANTPASTQSVNGISVSGFERLILRTGSGHDTIDNRGNGSSTDDLVTGAGNDWVALDQGTVDTGSGDDTITQAWGSVDGGADSDMLHMGGVYNSDTGYTRLVAYDASGTQVGDLTYTSSRTEIAAALVNATQFDFSSWWSGGWRTQLHAANIEHWNITGSATNDLIVARGEGSEYHGGGGFDTFYADWSASTKAISLGGTEAPTSVHWSGFERSLITGSALADLFDLSANSGNDDMLAGAGNDTILGIGAGDTIAGGEGKDVYVLADAAAVLVELAGGGKDEVHTAFDYTLANEFEVLRLLGSADLSGTGHEARNILFGNDGNNVLHGLGGKDRLVAGAGADTLFGDEGNDKLLGGSGNDSLHGGAGNDRLIGGGGDDLFMLESSAASNGLDKVLDLQAGIGGDVVDLGAFFGLAGATALDGNPDGGTSLDALALPQTLTGQNLFALAGDFGADGPDAKELAALLQGTHVDDGSRQAIVVQDLLSGQGVLFFADERSSDNNTTLQVAELKAVAVLTLDGGLPSTALWAENFLLSATGG